MPHPVAMTDDVLRILGVDPGLRCTGVAVIERRRDGLLHVDCGCLRPAPGEIPGRLAELYRGLGEWIERHRPHCVAIETAFVSKNVSSALKIGQARGALVCAAAGRGLPVHEYAPRAMKLALTGHGNATKPEVQHMVRVLLGLSGEVQSDAADALGLAICHAHSLPGRGP